MRYKMQRFFAIVVTLAVSTYGFASDELDLYTWLYEQSVSIYEQYSIIKTVSDLNIADTGSLYADALTKLNEQYANLKSNSERSTANALAKLLCIELGELKYENAANDLWRLGQLVTDPVVRGEVLTAIGRVRSKEYLPQLIQVLNGLNLKAPVNRSDAEKVAYGAIMGLEKYRANEVYEPVFYAANGWYSKPVKDLAKQVLPNIVDDPRDVLITIMKKGDYDVKRLALETMYASKAPVESKAALAAFAYNDGWTQGTSNKQDRNNYAVYRKIAMAQLVEFGIPDEIVPLLDRSYREGFDVEEKLNAIAALSRSATDESTAFLVAYLTDMNARRKADVVTQLDERIVRALIPALGRTGKPAARSPLSAIAFMGWQPAVVKLAEEALKNIP